MEVGRIMNFFVGSNICSGQVFVSKLLFCLFGFCWNNEIESFFIIVSAVQPV